MFNWFKKLRGEKVEVFTESIPFTTLIRWYMYDLSVKDTNKLATEFNMMPVSIEGDEKEKQDSAQRLTRIAPLIPFMHLMADINSQALSVVQQDELKALGLTEEQMQTEAEFLQLFYRNLSFAAIISSISAAAELGLVSINGTLTDIGGPNE